MPFSVEDRSAIKVLRQDKQYGAETLLKMFPNKNWTLGGLMTANNCFASCVNKACLFDY